MRPTIIAWTHFSSNALKYRTADGRSVWACVKTSTGCEKCYSAVLAKRYGRGGPFNAGEMAKLTPYLDPMELRTLLTSQAIAGKRVFVGDMTDLAGNWVPEDFLTTLFAVFALRPDVTWQLLTKRPARYAAFAKAMTSAACHAAMARTKAEMNLPRLSGRAPRWPLPNVWAGTSTENQATADERIPQLLSAPAAVHWISYEPALSAINIARFLGRDKISWVVQGGESGAGFRPMDLNWARSVRAQCQAAGVAYFFKQQSHFFTERGIELDGEIVREYPTVRSPRTRHHLRRR